MPRVFLFLGALMLLPAAALADHTRALGSCNEAGTVCAGPEAEVTVIAWDFDHEDLRGGLSPGLGYGITWLADRPYSVGIACYLSYQRQGDRDQATPAVMVHVARHIRVGMAVELVDGDSTPLLLFGTGMDFGPEL